MPVSKASSSARGGDGAHDLALNDAEGGLDDDDDGFIVDDQDRKIASSTLNIDAMDTMYKIFGDMSAIHMRQLPGVSQAQREAHARATVSYSLQ